VVREFGRGLKRQTKRLREICANLKVRSLGVSSTAVACERDGRTCPMSDVERSLRHTTDSDVIVVREFGHGLKRQTKEGRVKTQNSVRIGKFGLWVSVVPPSHANAAAVPARRVTS